MLFAQFRHKSFDRFASGFAHDIADEKNVHAKILIAKHAKDTQENEPQITRIFAKQFVVKKEMQ